ncbi:glycosyltransferase family 2 protein [Formosa sp. 4Alg 33]|uniref:glycosyltransferase family 2 protein n=1 Tax=Formosa sp. 4Alg 33 TaxID=3382189 RepID=UPI003D9C0847
MKLSIIVGFKNRDLTRIKRFLNSLENQTFKDFELIFVDYGSDLNIAREVKQLVNLFGFAQYIYNDTRGWPWNRSHALNSGLKFAQGEYILFSDVDLIYSPKFIEQSCAVINKDGQYFMQFYLLPENYSTWDSIEIEDSFNLTAKGTKGAIHFVNKEKLLSIGGFDEFYCFWGQEDIDLFGRLETLGLKESWLSIDAPVFHQWHPIVSNTKSYFFPEKWYDQMVIYDAANKNEVVRNKAGWGAIFTAQDRSIFHRTEEVIFKLPENITLNTKPKVIKDLVYSVNNLKENQYLTIMVSIKSSPKKHRKARGLGILKQLISKYYYKQVLVNEDYVNDLERLSSLNRTHFIPELDIYFFVWQLIKYYDTITDYRISISNDKLEISLC